MVDGNIDSRSVEAMEKFKDYSKEAQQNMQSLQQQMDKFTSSMAMTKSHSTDLHESLRQLSKTQPFQQMEESIKEVQSGLEKTIGAQRQPAGGQSIERKSTSPPTTEEGSGVTVNLRIDVSGVTDRTDKRQLAREISAMVTKELRTKIGGPLSKSGFNRSG